MSDISWSAVQSQNPSTCQLTERTSPSVRKADTDGAAPTVTRRARPRQKGEGAWLIGFALGLLVVLVVGCGNTAPEPLPYLDIVRSGEWAKPDEVELDRATLLAGLARWEPLGFRVGAPAELPECDWRWYEGDDRECVFTVGYHARPELERREDAGYAIPQLRQVWLDADDLTALELERVVAHEVGHLLLFAGQTHLPAGQRGLMQRTFGGDGPSIDDAALFCRLIAVCGGEP